jgi:transposase
MEDEQRRTAKRQMMDLMQAGTSWQEAAQLAGVQVSRSTAYRWFASYRTQGAPALLDGRHGHPSKVRDDILSWLQSRCRQAPQTKSKVIQKELYTQFGRLISITHLNRLRVRWGRVFHPEKKNAASRFLL